MKLCFHNLLHIADSIENTGPCWATWQFPIERVCEILLPLARSRVHPYKNILVNNIHVWEMFNHLQFYQNIHTAIFPLQEVKHNPNNLAYSQSDSEEVLRSPSKRHNLRQSELKKIKEHFSTTHNVRGRKLMVISNFICENLFKGLFFNQIIYFFNS
ncbi:hypothetical protein C1646_632235 [Rhizophagus diaphanus]|nr:hypothetical protein C1646_632235 [Rhizophagus diaphanus] [Rhizophagus sp. MUCL 43196]